MNKEFSRALTEAGLFVGDAGLADYIGTVRKLDVDFPEQAVGKAIRAAKPGGSSDDVLAGLRHLYKLAAALRLVELAAIALLRAETIEQSRSSVWRLVGRFRRKRATAASAAAEGGRQVGVRDTTEA